MDENTIKAMNESMRSNSARGLFWGVLLGIGATIVFLEIRAYRKELAYQKQKDEDKELEH